MSSNLLALFSGVVTIPNRMHACAKLFGSSRWLPFADVMYPIRDISPDSQGIAATMLELNNSSERQREIAAEIGLQARGTLPI